MGVLGFHMQLGLDLYTLRSSFEYAYNLIPTLREKKHACAVSVHESIFAYHYLCLYVGLHMREICVSAGAVIWKPAYVFVCIIHSSIPSKCYAST